jgi:hypothetical protein
MTLLVLDYGLFLVHLALVLFNLLGWLPQRTRKAHLTCIALTWTSWIALGFFYGFGYCPLTDWHWEVRQARGLDMPNNYIKFLIDNLFGVNSHPELVDLGTLLGGIGALAASLYVNFLKTSKASPKHF